jgi:hypothetical protein
MNTLSQITKYTIILIAIVQVIGAIILADTKSDLVWQILLDSIMVAIVIACLLLLSLLSSKPLVSLPVSYLVASIAETVFVFLYMVTLFR